MLGVSQEMVHPPTVNPTLKGKSWMRVATLAVGSSVSIAISVDDVAEDDDDDDGIKILEDEDDNNNDVPVITVNAQGDSTTSTPSTTNISNASIFPPFALMDLHANVVADIKGKNHKRILNQLRWQYYNLDTTGQASTAPTGTP